MIALQSSISILPRSIAVGCDELVFGKSQMYRIIIWKVVVGVAFENMLDIAYHRSSFASSLPKIDRGVRGQYIIILKLLDALRPDPGIWIIDLQASGHCRGSNPRCFAPIWQPQVSSRMFAAIRVQVSGRLSIFNWTQLDCVRTG